jgi:type I restriction enzyme M protein
VHLLVWILDPKVGESVYDPACGSGGMLVETINAVHAGGGDPREVRLYGQEVNLTTSAIARMNLSFHRATQSEIRRGDTLREPRFRNADGMLTQFDVVVANPPFSLSNWGADMWAADGRAFCGVPPAKNGDFAWIQHMISSMNDKTGRVGVVMPHGVLFRGGTEAKIRQCLVERDMLEAVIGLPPNLFYSTSIPGCLLIFRADKLADQKNHVLFIDGSSRFRKGRNQNYMSEEDYQAVLTAYNSGEDPDGEGGVDVRLVPFDEIKNNRFDLNIGRYVRAQAADAVDLSSALKAYTEARTKRIETEQRMFERLRAIGMEVPGE